MPDELPKPLAALLAGQLPNHLLPDGIEHGALAPSFSELIRAGIWPEPLSVPPSPADDLAARAKCDSKQTSLEALLFGIFDKAGTYEIITDELVSHLATHVREMLSPVTLHGLKGRTDLNGAEADVVGPIDEESRRVPVRVRGTNEGVKVRPQNCFDGGFDDLPLVLELGAGNGDLAHCHECFHAHVFLSKPHA